MELKDNTDNIDSNTKNKVKIQIVDISKKKKENISTKIQDKLNSENISPEKIASNLFDSVIYLGGGFIFATEKTSKALSKLGSYLINK